MLRLFYVVVTMPTQHPVSSTFPLPPLIVIVGATAVGKTRLSIDLATRFKGEIINADSRLFYRGMDIGTAKPSRAELGRVRHHLIDILDPNEPVSLAMFQDLAYAAIDDVLARGRIPFLVGGTPQYVNAVVEGWQIPRVEPDPDVRARLQGEADQHGPDHLLGRLRQVDPVSAERNAGNLRRIIRALEVWEKTGMPITAQQGKGPARYEALELELWRPREELHQRIEIRVRDQVRDGLFDEIRGLIGAGANPTSPSFASIGYRQAMPYIRGEASLEDVIERIRFDSHKLVRHQATWWRKNPRLVRVDLSQPDGPERATEHITLHLAHLSRRTLV
jgi:tRNA dimethylallyltransferase